VLNKLTFVLLAVLSCASGEACTGTGAFGVKFGAPAPARAPEVDEYYFSGGTELKGYLHPVPEPIEGFEIYSHWSHKDRQSVYAVLAYRQLIKDKKLLFDDAYRGSVLDKTKLEISKLAELWEKAYGLKFQRESDSGLSWVAETDDVKAWIATRGGEFLYIECESKPLRKAAWSKALGR
jgi:hypothetical protein